MEFYKFDVECTNRSPSTPTRGVQGPDRSAARIALPTATTGPPPQLPSSSRDERSRQQDYIDCRDQGFKKSLGIRRGHAKSAHNREWWDSLWSVVGRAPPVGGCLPRSAARAARSRIGSSQSRNLQRTKHSAPEQMRRTNPKTQVKAGASCGDKTSPFARERLFTNSVLA
jgi:hypothetical protein